MTQRISLIGQIFLLLAVLQVGFLQGQAYAQPAQLGKLSFPNSGTQKAQADFIDGVLYLHSFEYQPAREAFLRAQKADPAFALAYWGGV